MVFAVCITLGLAGGARGVDKLADLVRAAAVAGADLGQAPRRIERRVEQQRIEAVRSLAARHDECRRSGRSARIRSAIASWSKPRKTFGTTKAFASPWRSVNSSSRSRKIGMTGLYTTPSRQQAMAAEAGLHRLVHISCIGADSRSTSAYIRARGEGEDAVRAGFPGATILRPSVMFGPDDAFLSTLVGLVRRLPVVPLFGNGSTRLQPVHVEDVAAAVAILVTASDPPAPTCELGGPEVFSYRALIELVMHHVGRRRALPPVPFPLWDALAAACWLLPSPPLTQGQVALMRQDNVADPGLPGFGALGINPASIETELLRRMTRP